MIKPFITAISIYHNGERILVKANSFGKFRVPVTEVIQGQLKTRMKNLTAREVVNHEIIKNCDPTLYLQKGERFRVFEGGISGYLPAHVDGIIKKHDDSYKKTEILKQRVKSSQKNESLSSYKQASLDMYGWYPTGDPYEAD